MSAFGYKLGSFVQQIVVAAANNNNYRKLSHLPTERSCAKYIIHHINKGIKYIIKLK